MFPEYITISGKKHHRKHVSMQNIITLKLTQTNSSVYSLPPDNQRPMGPAFAALSFGPKPPKKIGQLMLTSN
jgi:hypothetical protein